MLRRLANTCPHNFVPTNTTMSSTTPYTDEWITVPQNMKLYARHQAPTEIKGAVVFTHGFIEHLGRYGIPSLQAATN